MTPEDAAAIVRTFENEYATAFNRRDASALCALFTEDVTIVTEWGDVVTGRAEFERGLRRAFTSLAGELTIENTPALTEMVTEDVIVSHGTSRRVGAWVSGEDKLVYTRVLVRRGGAWRLAANHVAEPSSRPDPRASRK